MKDSILPQILISGHRNPDIDSLASAAALADLRRRHTRQQVTALCPGVLPDRARYLFNKFNVKPPVCCNDLYVKVGDRLSEIDSVNGNTTLFEAVEKLRNSQLSQLPVTDRDNRFLGTISGMALLGNLLAIGRDTDGGKGLTGRIVESSIEMIRTVLQAELLTGDRLDQPQTFAVYVAAMSEESFASHLPTETDVLAVIAGDRPEIHRRVIALGVRLLIVTGNCSIEPELLTEAAVRQVSILRTGLDSATVIRRLKFSTPVSRMLCNTEENFTVSPGDRLRDVREKVLNSPFDLIPATDGEGKLAGVLLKRTLHSPPPFQMILVDHNEIDQSLPGAEEIPVIEVVDHHRIGMMPTAVPIRFTGDVVGSTCTLVASMYRNSGESLSPGMAGLLLGGIISDTLLLRSPTTAELDRRMCEWLEKISGVTGETLMQELLQIDSPLAVKPAPEVIGSDRKNYTDGKIRFALSQVEESNLELLHQRRQELSLEIRKIIEAEKLDFFGLLVTDAVRENSELLILGDPGVIRNLPYRKIDRELYALPGVLSRKKQLLPQVLSITAALQQK